MVVSGVGNVGFLCRGAFCPRLGDENGFLLATPLGPAGRGVIGGLLPTFEDVSADVLYLDKALCWINSQLLGRITKIQVVKSMTSGL